MGDVDAEFVNPYPELKPKAKVTVRFDGFEVGEASVSPEGGYLIVKLNDSPVADEMRAVMRADVIDYVSINPRNK